MSEEKSMNIHERVAKVKQDLTQVEIKKSGHNKYAGFKYHELSDFLAEIVKLNDKHGVNDTIRIDPNAGVATLRLTNTENSEDFTETVVPYVEAEMLGKNGGESKVDAIQRMGSTITYMRRYLYMTAYAIQENDAVDSAPQQPKAQPIDNKKEQQNFRAWAKKECPENTDKAIERALNEVGEFSLDEVDFTPKTKQLLAKGVKAYKQEQEVGV